MGRAGYVGQRQGGEPHKSTMCADTVSHTHTTRLLLCLLPQGWGCPFGEVTIQDINSCMDHWAAVQHSEPSFHKDLEPPQTAQREGAAEDRLDEG